MVVVDGIKKLKVNIYYTLINTIKIRNPQPGRIIHLVVLALLVFPFRHKQVSKDGTAFSVTIILVRAKIIQSATH